jgi:hypothetical protein
MTWAKAVLRAVGGHVRAAVLLTAFVLVSDLGHRRVGGGWRSE